MKYAIYDKAADGYLTKMVFEVGYSQHTQFECALTECITNAELLDTKEAANLAVVNIEGFKFMEKGRFVIHSFDETLADQYIISEAGNPTKVVDNITVDLSGTIDVKYGTMPLHWSTPYLIRAITRLDALQKAASDVYTHWNDTFDIYKVITVIDERECTHYQFIKVTEKGLDSAKEAAGPLNKRIEELEAKVESIKEEAHLWKTMHESEAETLDILKNVIDTIYTDLQSVTACDDLKETSKALSHNSDLEHIFMPTKTSYILDKGNCLTAKDEIGYIVDQMIAILESLTLNKSCAFSSAEEVNRAKALANDIINICEENDKFEITLKKFSQLYEAINGPSDDDDTITYAFKGVLEIFSSLEDHVRGIIDESVTWKNRAVKAEKALDNQKKLNEANVATIVRYRNERRDMVKENHELRTARDCSAETIYAIRNAITNSSTNTVDCIESRMRHDPDFNSDPFMAGVRENIKDICVAIKRNLANNDLKNSEITKTAGELSEWKRKCKAKDCEYEMLANKLEACEIILESTRSSLTATIKERDKALELKEMYKRQANSLYGMTIPGICNGKKMLIKKEKYDDLLECVKTINTTYDVMKCADLTMNKPVWLDGIIHRIENLTK